jgi:D-alanyl-D-alanine carboxypeptidase (penicillin-binding protein 5/6)
VQENGPRSPLKPGTTHPPRRYPSGLALGVALAAVAGIAAFLLIGIERTGESAGRVPVGPTPSAEGARATARPAPAAVKRFKLRRAPAALAVDRELRRPPRAGILFDVDTGEVLWERHPRRELPIASLTKMMTALLIARGHRLDERVKISKRAVRTTGSKVGLLPKGKRVALEPLLYGLLMVSGNDTAVALAEHSAGSVPRFVERMNEEAERRRLDCSRFSSPHGLADSGNYSCPRDLAAMARAILADRRLAEIVGSQAARFDFPVKGGRLELYNINPLMQLGRPGITGVKTGYTDTAGRCYVTTARHRGRHLGVVLLHSPDPINQIDKLLADGFKVRRRT